MKEKRIPRDFDIKEFDEKGRVCISKSGNMTAEIWENVIFIFLLNCKMDVKIEFFYLLLIQEAVDMIIDSKPSEIVGKWVLLSLDGHDQHVSCKVLFFLPFLNF